MDVALTLSIFIVMGTLLVRGTVAPAIAMVGAAVALTLVGVVSPAQAFAGLSSPAVIALAGLFVVARALQLYGGTDRAFKRLADRETGYRRALTRLTIPVAAASTILANTPLVAALAPQVRDWAEQAGRSPSRFLMPLSFAAMLGGTVTTIGTSTTLASSAIFAQTGGEPFGLLEVTPLGVPVAIVGLVVMLLLAPSTVPDRTTVSEAVTTADGERRYAITVKVDWGGLLDGSTLETAPNLGRIYATRLDRAGEHPISPVPPHTVLRPGDRLTFMGPPEFLTNIDGTTVAERQVRLLEETGGHYEVVIGASSPLVGRTPKQAAFRGRYGAAILAAHRGGGPLEGPIATTRLHAGDTLLVAAEPELVERWQGRPDFAVIAPLEPVAATERAGWRRPFTLAVSAAMVGVTAAGWTPIVTAVLAAVALLVLSRTITVEQARGSLDMDVLLMIASAGGLAAALQESGIAAFAGEIVGAVANVAGPVAAVAAIVTGALLLTEGITNVAAAAMLIPIAEDVAMRIGYEPVGLAVAVAVACSASFLTPIGYQTNTIVFGLGGYRFGDFWRLGLPLNLVVVGVSAVVVPMVWGPTG